MFDAGVESPLGDVLPLHRSLVGEVDVAELEVPETVRLVEECAEAERRFAALRVMAAATLENKAVWRREGFRSLAEWMADKAGIQVGQAGAGLEMAGHLEKLPALAVAFREGRLSEIQAREIAEVASEVPDAEEQLIEAAGKLSLRGFRDECRRIEAAALIDEDQRHCRVHRQRRARAWVRNGAGHFNAVMTPDKLARFVSVLDSHTDGIVADAIKGGWFENRDVHRVDALVDLVRPESTVAAGPDTMLHVVIDYDALMRGHSVTGERCEIRGIGPCGGRRAAIVS
ncbi:MAG: DUF222 domain-containing protein [Acidimicrobiia bacterium]